jgi:diaminopimelate decarboxylase
VKKRKEKTFVIVDAAMNDLIRPTLYQSEHTILPEKNKKTSKNIKADVVGPICESGDYLGKDIRLPADIKRGDLLITAGAGAYTFSMASNYNSRPRVCEVLVNGRKHRTIRKRELYRDLWRGEL